MMSTKRTPTRPKRATRMVRSMQAVKTAQARMRAARAARVAALFALAILACCGLAACGQSGSDVKAPDERIQESESGTQQSTLSEEEQQNIAKELEAQQKETEEALNKTNAEALRAALNISEDYRSSFVHGDKPASCQKYIMLHDTEGSAGASSVIESWDASGNMVAAHFIVNKDGSIWQCVPLDKITHHAGFGDTGHNASFGVSDESRDDKEGTTSIGSDYADYGMNSYSVGIEMVHVGGGEGYPEAQLEALDGLIAYIDAYYGFESEIVDHKAWRTTNSDTSEEFAGYLANYKASRHH